MRPIYNTAALQIDPLCIHMQVSYYIYTLSRHVSSLDVLKELKQELFWLNKGHEEVSEKLAAKTKDDVKQFRAKDYAHQWT